MKKIFIIMMLAGTAAGCSKGDKSTEPAGKPILKVSISAFATETRSAVNYGIDDYFTGWGNDLENILVVFDGTERIHKYSSGTLVSTSDAFEFPSTANPVDIEVSWPSGDMRKAVGSADRKDQSTKEGFMAEDWLSAEMKNVMPAYSVPVFLKHERAKVSFVLAGGLDGVAAEEFTFGDFKAFCSAGKIELMIDPAADAALFAANASGTIKAAGKTYVYTLDADISGIEAGSYHEIILNL